MPQTGYYEVDVERYGEKSKKIPVKRNNPACFESWTMAPDVWFILETWLFEAKDKDEN